MGFPVRQLTIWELACPRAKIQREVERLYPRKKPQLASGLVSAAAAAGLGLSEGANHFSPHSRRGECSGQMSRRGIIIRVILEATCHTTKMVDFILSM